MRKGYISINYEILHHIFEDIAQLFNPWETPCPLVCLLNVKYPIT